MKRTASSFIKIRNLTYSTVKYDTALINLTNTYLLIIVTNTIIGKAVKLVRVFQGELNVH